MRIKHVLLEKKATDKLQKGIDLVANTIKTTLSPKGRDVVVKNIGLQPQIMNDGFQIANHIQDQDPVVNTGVEMMKDICRQTNEVAGDGTTSTAIVSQKLIELGFKDERNPVDIKNELMGDLKGINEELGRLSQPVTTSEQIKNVAFIAGNNDKEIGDAMQEVYEKLGKGFNAIPEGSNKKSIETEIIKGIHFKNGFKEATVFINHPRRMEGIYKDMRVLCLDDKLHDQIDILPFIQKMAKKMGDEHKSIRDIRLFVITKELSVNAEALNFMAQNLVNAMQNKVEQDQPVGFWNLVVEAPSNLEDVAIATGGVLINKAFELRTAEPEQVLGSCKKVIATKKTTTIIGGNGDKKKLEERIEGLKKEKDEASKKSYKDELETRINIISSGIAKIHSGGITEIEMGERYLRIEDAIQASKASIEEGVVAGGGVTYQRLANKCQSKLLKKALEEIPRQIAVNSGKEYKPSDGTKGYNALTDKFEDLTESGVVDSTKVTRAVIENSVSFASHVILTSGCVIEDEIESKLDLC